MNCGIDMDATLIDTHWDDVYNSNKVSHRHTEVCGIPSSWEYYPTLCQRCLEQCVNDPTVLESATLRDGAKEVLTELSHTHALWLVSHRPPALTLAGINMLKRFGIYELFASVIWNMDSKLVTCRRYSLNVLIDDGPYNIEELIGTEITPIIMDQPYNHYFQANVRRASTWQDVIPYIKEIDENYRWPERHLAHLGHYSVRDSQPDTNISNAGPSIMGTGIY